MPAQPSFDVTSKIDLQEVDNAVNQTLKEIGQRFDFKGAKFAIDFKRAENVLELSADDTMKLDGIWDVLQTRMIRRGVPVKNLKPADIEIIGGGRVKRTITLQQGVPIEAARDVVKFLKDQKLKKVQANIQSDQVRVSSPSKDELQSAMKLLREKDFGVQLGFGNYR